MNKPLTFLLSLTFLFLFSGCVNDMVGKGTVVPEQVVSNVTVFHTIKGQHKGKSVLVLPFQKELESSLEFQNYKKIIEKYLQRYGFNIVQEKDDSDFIAFVSYGVDKGKQELISSPVFGLKGGGTRTFSGSAYNSGGGGTTYLEGTEHSMPTLGVVGSSTSSITRYTRQFAMDLVETSTLEGKKINKVYEGRVKSAGLCGTVLKVMPHMILWSNRVQQI